MVRSRGFLSVTAADFLVRAAYQMGKTPLLPLFAASLGAGDVLLGFIISVSTLTGMVLKPFIGILSDRTGRRIWLLVGTAVFAGMPFVYGFVDSPDKLVLVRVAHGLATAIYGPVTLAYVAELSNSNRAERLGWFSMARNAGLRSRPRGGRLPPIENGPRPSLHRDWSFEQPRVRAHCAPPGDQAHTQSPEATIREAGGAGL